MGGRGWLAKCILAVSEGELSDDDRLFCRGDGCRGQSAVSKKLDWLDMATGSAPLVGGRNAQQGWPSGSQSNQVTTGYQEELISQRQATVEAAGGNLPVSVFSGIAAR